MKIISNLVIFILIFLLLINYFLTSTVDLRSQFFPLPPTPCQSQSPLKVYMYDLPRRFNIAMMNPLAPSHDQTPVTTETLPDWPNKYESSSQYAVEYWMMASLLRGGDEEREAVRVWDPESADIYFVPFFSSLSFDRYGKNMKDPKTEIDKQLQADILKLLRESVYWQRSAGRDHVIPMQHPNAFRFHRGQVNASILIVVDFGRYSKSIANLAKDIVAPHMHVVESFTDDISADPYDSRSTLLFFKGRTVRKDEGKVRAELAKVLAGYEDVHYEHSHATGESIKASSDGMRSSKFCLNPAGDTPSSCRLFDAIVSHCVPVIVSDHIELPYEDELDYKKFSLFFSVDEALTPDYMVKQLREFPKERWIEMWKQLKNVSRHFEYQHPPKKDDATNMIWRQVKHKLPSIKLAVHRSRRLKVPDRW